MDLVTKNLVNICFEALKHTKKTLSSIGEECREELPKEGEPLTKGDLAVSKALKAYLMNSEISAEFQSEEAGIIHSPKNPRYKIAFDEIDGTFNFSRNIFPCCTVLFALENPDNPRYEDVLFAGVIDHTTDKLWHAVREEGCFLNEERVYASDKKTLDERTSVIIDLGPCPSREDVERYLDIYTSSWVRNVSCAGVHLAGIASGNFDGFSCSKQKAHELGAGYLLIKEAGGCLTDWEGNSFDKQKYDFDAKHKIVAASTKELNRELRLKIKF